jgi:hypothetical protein
MLDPAEGSGYDSGRQKACRSARLSVSASFCAKIAAKQGMVRELLAELQWYVAGIDGMLLF